MNWIEDKCMIEFPARVSVTMVNDVQIPTDLYEEYSEENCNDTFTKIVGTSSIDWECEYKNNCLTILDLLHELVGYVKNEMKTTNISPARERYLTKILDACDGWVEQDISVEEI